MYGISPVCGGVSALQKPANISTFRYSSGTGIDGVAASSSTKVLPEIPMTTIDDLIAQPLDGQILTMRLDVIDQCLERRRVHGRKNLRDRMEGQWSYGHKKGGADTLMP